MSAGNRAITLTTYTAVTAAALVILSAGILGYTALYDLFVSIGLFSAWLGVFFPLLFDLAEVAAAVAVFNAKLQGEEDRFAWGMVIFFAGLGIVANVGHALAAYYTGKIDTIQVILAIFATSLFPLSVALVTHLVKRVIARSIERQAAVSRLTELTGQHDMLLRQIEHAKSKSGHWLDLDKFIGRDVKKNTPEWSELRQLIWLRDNKQCKKCKRDLQASSFHCHHMRPESMGGKGEPVNLVTLCDQCHGQIHDKLLFDLPVRDKEGFLKVARKAKQAKVDQRRTSVLALLSEGMSQPAIADELKVSLTTIKRDVVALNGQVGLAQ